MVVIAEMAKFLRDAAMIGADVYFFQQLGEAASRRASAPDITEDDARLALERRDPLWEELFSTEQVRIIHLLVERVDIGPGGADVRVMLDGLASLARDLGAPAS